MKGTKTEKSTFDTQLDNLFESFGSSQKKKRIEALSEMYHISSHYYVPLLFDQYDYLTKCYSKCLQNKQEIESVLVIQNMQSMVISVPKYATKIFLLYHQTLLSVIMNKNPENLKVESLRLLSVLCLLLKDHDMNDELNSILFQLVEYSNKKRDKKITDRLLTEILRTCGILLKSLPTSFLERPNEGEHSELFFYQFDYLYYHFLNYFDSTSQEIKNESAQIITLLWSIKQSDASLDSVDFETQFDELIWMLNDLSSQCTKSNKKNKFKKKIQIQEMIDSLQGNNFPTKEFQIKSNSIKITNWVHLKQLELFKKILKTGFQKHMEKNNLFWGLFNYQIINYKKTNSFCVRSQDRKQYHKKNSKILKNKRKLCRQQKMKALDNYF
ncbi:hypothetical protein M0813_10536 [Anaeramoeba flamelloides]|uniref:Interferon-related developmental regulator N-terminal domain-containing protein n=1 Tax=Anaeramoeba flamelloides TaxID=1746091 RepID=A0ABQ8X5R7_9EUKA|nr:hypothetical protein M0813_10536 [Anaeramoeba flamelloides]